MLCVYWEMVLGESQGRQLGTADFHAFTPTTNVLCGRLGLADDVKEISCGTLTLCVRARGRRSRVKLRHQVDGVQTLWGCALPG